MAMKDEAISYITTFNNAFQGSKVGKREEIRLQEVINTTLKQLEKSQKEDNRFLISLEKFYQSTSFLVGLTGLKLNEEAYQAWRSYDRWHYDHVKSKLSLYGNIVGPI